MNKKQQRMLCRIVVATVLVGILQFVDAGRWVLFALYLGVYFIIGYDILQKAVRGIVNGRMFDENFLMVVATIGAFALALYEEEGDFNEAIAVMLLYQIGEFFQSYAVGKSRKDITALMDIRPDYANVEEDGHLQRVDPDDVEVGTIIVVQPGEKVPIDGIVREGVSSLNTAALTGESLPRDIKEGDEIISGCINMTGVLRIETTKEFGESTVSKLLELMEDSASHKSQSEAFISRFARVYTPIVCYAALALAVVSPLIVWLFTDVTFDFDLFEPWIYRALTFLVISCPCALVVSIPLSFFAGIGCASKAGILIKGSNYLEALSKVRTVVFDKTGTLTEGSFQVNATHHPDFDEDSGECHCAECQQGPRFTAGGQQAAGMSLASLRILEYAAMAECASSHPISISLRKAYGKEIDNSRVADIQEISGHGVTARIDGRLVTVGNEKLMLRVGARYVHCHSVGTIVHVAIDGQYAGHIVISDVIKAHSVGAIEALRQAGVTRVVMLTGDAKPVADDVARSVGVTEVYSELLPDAKVARVEALLEAVKKENGGDGSTVAFVGDGINDAPVLSRADIGFAMGALGSDAAIEAADVVLMDDDPMKISKAVRISRRTLGIVWQNIIFSFGIKLVCLILGAFGIANMWLAIFADTGVMILAVLNAVRAMYLGREESGEFRV